MTIAQSTSTLIRLPKVVAHALFCELGVSPKVIEQFAHADRAVQRLKEIQERQKKSELAQQEKTRKAAEELHQRQLAEGEKKKKSVAEALSRVGIEKKTDSDSNSCAEEHDVSFIKFIR